MKFSEIETIFSGIVAEMLENEGCNICTKSRRGGAYIACVDLICKGRFARILLDSEQEFGKKAAVRISIGRANAARLCGGRLTDPNYCGLGCSVSDSELFWDESEKRIFLADEKFADFVEAA